MVSREEAIDILFKSDLKDGDEARNKRLAAAPKSLRQSLLREDPKNIETRASAAIEIQRTWRGYRSRCNLQGILQPEISKTAVYSGSQHVAQRDEEFLDYDERGRLKSDARLKLDDAYNEYLQRRIAEGADPSELVTFEDFCATNIQEWWQDQSARRSESPPPSQPPPPPKIPEKKKRDRPLNVREAASIIQRAWRRHIDIQVYRYYRDLINFKSRGDPKLMLRCINPNEAKMLDSASGVHVKFRLAGERFPPNIYYKVFTHRPIQDLCSNSPKDYTKAEVKFKMARDQHNTSRPVPGEDDHVGWYRRVDNNGWRLVSDRLIHHIMADPVTWESSQKVYEYHHDKLQRKQDVEKRKKKRKIEWMKKMYKDGMLKAKSDDKETVTLIEGAAAGMVATVDNFGPDALEDWEVDELLDWTTSLNFEDYQNGWKELATSANSEKQTVQFWRRYTASEDKIRLLTSTADPFELTVSTGPSRYQSTQQSRNTPVSSQGSAGPVQVNS